MNTPLPALQWKQNGVNHIVKLLPGGRIGALSNEILAEIRESNGKPDAKIMAIRSGNVQLVRQLQNEHIEGKELATTELEEWEESMAGPSGPFDVTYCQPKTPTPPKGRPCILYLHGGGWQYGSRKVVLPFCRYLAEQANAVVAVPEYHLAPEHRWPAALEDCWQLLCRLHAQAETRGIDPARITVAGDSAGGNLAALCAHRDRDRSLGMVNSQVLYYPALSVRETDGLKDYHLGWKIIFTMMRRVSGSCRASWPSGTQASAARITTCRRVSTPAWRPFRPCGTAIFPACRVPC